MTKENNKSARDLCACFWKQFRKNFENTELASRVLGTETSRKTPVFAEKHYRRQRFFIHKYGEIVAKVFADKVDAKNTKGKKGIYVELLLEKNDKEVNEFIFDYLEKDKEIKRILEKELCLSLKSEKGEKTKRSNIFVHNDSFNPRNEDEWQKQHEWIVKAIEAFDSVFTHRLENIELP